MRHRMLALGVLFLFLVPSFAKGESGKASFYSGYKHTANGERFYSSSLTAAHKSLPFNTIVKVENVVNGKSVIVRVNNSGPFVKGRIIDLTPTAFKEIASLKQGVVKVKLEIIKLGDKPRFIKKRKG
jgi:rare lipoprotein A